MRTSAFFYAGQGIFRRKLRQESWWDFDGFEGFPPFLPMLVFEPLHVWDWRMEATELSLSKRESQYAFRAIPLRWSLPLLLRAYLRIWLFLPLITGFLFFMSCAHSLPARALGFGLMSVCVAGLVGLWALNVRDCEIRAALGRHRLGTSDPATWTDDLRGLIAPASTWFKTDSFAAAVESLLAQQRYCDAMWAARLCVALEDPERGEEATTRVLREMRTRGELAKCQQALRQPGEVQPRPLVRSTQGKDAEFWYQHLFDGETERATEVQYAGHIGGLLAYASEPDESPEEEQAWIATIEDRKRRPGPHGRAFFFGGAGVVASVILFTVVFVKVANTFRLPTLADQAIQQMKANGR